MADGELFEELTEDDSTYDAFEKDIAVLNFYYGDPEFVGKYFHCLWIRTGWKAFNHIVIFIEALPTFCLFLFPEYERTERMTWSDFLSNIGGLCGLCLGFSFMSGIEIIYWIFKIIKNVVS